MLHRLASSLCAAVIATLAGAAFSATAAPLESTDDRVVLMRVDQPAEDTLFDLEQAIVGQGLVIDYHSHVGDMLARTREDVGSDRILFTKADIFVFCSAALSREMMEADLTTVALCPYSMFVIETPEEAGASYVGYRRLARSDTPADSPLAKIDALLDGIAKEAAGL